MSNKMLIDASHPEETRVVVVSGNRIEEFDFESEHKKQLKGNIYLARVTRVEPSLQAAFVEYGGNRHGFLAFSEIHPDYYQIPLADRQALLDAEEQAVKAESEAEDKKSENETSNKRGKKRKSTSKADSVKTEVISEEIDTDDNESNSDDVDNSDEAIEIVGAEDALEEVPDIRRIQRKEYQIQEVIKRRQILLVQVVKEERGNKGAALTTYLSLAGRYSVLMPNTARGGGISRKITNPQDRKRLKDVVKGLEVPKGMGVILRTAGANRTKVEIKRDYEYLMRLWDNVRSLTMESSAPTLVYEEGSLIKRSIRDLYNKDISEILVAGDNGYREAKDFMRMLMPSHAKVVQAYRETLPIFARNGIEAQLDKMVQPQVTLKSGGYLVINQTEALVAIDVNSGRSTKEHSVEETAIQTNLEAAEEVARQLRLRDLAGLVVIDFIDMEENRNIRAVEKKLKDCLKEDRARIQVGRISHFGLMEMSRQRIRASVLESTMQACPHCAGTGHIRSDSSMALHIIRSIEEYLLRNPGHDITVRTAVINALFVLNSKRDVLTDIENRFNVSISIEADDDVGTQQIAIYKGEVSKRSFGAPAPVLPVFEVEEELEVPVKTEAPKSSHNEAEEHNPHKRHKNNNRQKNQDGETKSSPNKKENNEQRIRHDNNDEDRRRKRRRGRRGGRRYRDHDDRHYTPYAEPVGPFSGKALAEIRAARQQQRMSNNKRTPAAEPIGPMFTIILDAKAPNMRNNKPNKHRRNGQKNQDSKAVLQTESAVINTENIEEDIVKPAKKVTRKKVNTSVDTKADATKETKTVETIEITTIKETKPARKKKAETKVKKTASETVTETKAKAKAKATTKPKADEKAKDEAKKTVTKEKVAEKKATASKSAPKIKETQETAPLVEPVVTSSDENNIEEKKTKRGGWWQKKGFF